LVKPRAVFENADFAIVLGVEGSSVEKVEVVAPSVGAEQTLELRRLKFGNALSRPEILADVFAIVVALAGGCELALVAQNPVQFAVSHAQVGKSDLVLHQVGEASTLVEARAVFGLSKWAPWG
jgi:hypothetical protein